LLALTRALLNPANKIAWLATLRAPWCGLNLKELYILASPPKHLTEKFKPQNDDFGITIWQSINDPNTLQKLDEGAQQNLFFLREQLKNALQNRGRKNLRNFIYDAWLSINGDSCLTKNADIEDVKIYFKLLETFDTGGDIKNINQFEEKIERLFTSPATTSNDTLQIMTIHKAKGLEFDTVILPGLHRQARQAEKQLILWTDQPRTKFGDELILTPIKNYAAQDDKIYNYLAIHEKHKNDSETMRLLYVAMTRAKCQLHLFGETEPKKEPKKRSFLSLIWPEVKKEFENTQKIQQIRTAHKTSSQLKRIVREKMNKQPAAPKSTSQIQDDKSLPIFADNINIHIGTVIHRILQQISIDGIDKWPKKRIQNALPHWQKMLIQLGISSNDLKYAEKQIAHVLKNIFIDARAQWILKKHQEHSSEFAISTTKNNQAKHYIIDRIFVDQNKRWVIDYKTTTFTGENIEEFIAQEKEKHQQQLINYQQLLMQLYPEKISCGLYYPAIPLWIEL